MVNFNFRNKRKSLQWQLLSRFFVILIILFLIMGVSQYLLMRQFLYKNKAGTLQQTFHNLDFGILSFVNLKEQIEENSSTIIKKLIDKNMSVAVFDSSGIYIAGSGKMDEMKQGKNPDVDFGVDMKRPIRNIAIPKLPKEDYMQVLREEGNLERTYKVVRDENNILQMVTWRKIGDLKSPSGLVQLSSPVGDIQDVLYTQIYIYLGGSVLILILGSLIGGAVFRKTLNPLYNMANTVERIDVEQLHTRLPEDNGSLEIDKLSKSFNKMLNGIDISFQKEQQIKERMRQFVSDASHELKTPLTSIHGFAEVLLRGAAKNEEQLNSALKSILLESDRLTKLVQDLLLITRLDQQLPVEMHIENINDVIKEVFPQLKMLAGEREARLELENSIMVNINRNQIKQVILNLFQNAVKNTDKKSGIIIISTNTQQINSEKFAVMKVTDNGAGISEKHINRIFDRFFRSDYHRSRESGGYGLGLSIVKSIVEAHDGKITVESTQGSGTSFTVYFKLCDSSNSNCTVK